MFGIKKSDFFESGKEGVKKLLLKINCRIVLKLQCRHKNKTV